MNFVKKYTDDIIKGKKEFTLDISKYGFIDTDKPYALSVVFEDKNRMYPIADAKTESAIKAIATKFCKRNKIVRVCSNLNGGSYSRVQYICWSDEHFTAMKGYSLYD